MKRCVGVMVLMTSALGGCKRAELSGPPELRLGRDECTECGMLVGEDRCSSAMLIDKDGVREHMVFDDIACMIDLETDPRTTPVVIERYVHDYESRRWIPLAGAVLVKADRSKLRTPMGSGIVAYAERATAEAGAARFGGLVMTYAELCRERTPAPDGGE